MEDGARPSTREGPTKGPAGCGAALRTIPGNAAGGPDGTWRGSAQAAAADAAGLAEGNRKEGWEALVGHTRKLIYGGRPAHLDPGASSDQSDRLPAVNWTEADGLAYAHFHRLDLMNEQAQVTDAWRKVLVRPPTNSSRT